jgi:hypothetical protein
MTSRSSVWAKVLETTKRVRRSGNMEFPVNASDLLLLYGLPIVSKVFSHFADGQYEK